jgi:alpha-1,2-mannosyltransferase
LLAVEIGVLAAAFGVIYVLASHEQMPGEFSIFYRAAQLARAQPSANPYLPAPGAEPYFYPPYFTLLLQPLTLLPPFWAGVVWLLFTGACLTGSLLLIDAIWPASQRTYVLLCVAALLFIPIQQGIYFGQVHVLLLVGCLLAYWLAQRGHQGWAGAIVLCLAALKVFPALLLLYFVLTGRWRTLIGVIVAIGVLGVATTLLMPWHEIPDWLGSLHSPGAAAMAASSANLGYRLGWPFLGLVLVVYVAIAWMLRSNPPEVFLWTLSSMLLSPLTWPHYLALILPGLYILSRTSRLWMYATALYLVCIAAGINATTDVLLHGSLIVLALWLIQAIQMPCAVRSDHRPVLTLNGTSGERASTPNRL